MNQKDVFKKIFIVTTFVLMLLPALVTFSSVLTSIFNKMGWYVWLQNVVVPFEARLVAVLIQLVGIKGYVTSGQQFSMLLLKNNQYLPIVLEWNCLGWQSLILLVITLFAGLRGPYTLFSKIETVLIGLIGTFLSNLFRISFVVALAYYWNNLAARIVHDYFAMFVALVWMIFYWWFVFRYVLEEKEFRPLRIPGI